jgi:hypothetical protein
LRRKLEEERREAKRTNRKARERKRKKLGERGKLRGKKTTNPCQSYYSSKVPNTIE